MTRVTAGNGIEGVTATTDVPLIALCIALMGISKPEEPALRICDLIDEALVVPIMTMNKALSATETIHILPGERWWGGCVDDGYQMPFSPGFRRDLLTQQNNQVMPLLVSSHGRYIWSETIFQFAVNDQLLSVTGGEPRLATPGGGLRGAVLGAGRDHFAPSGKMPHPLLFSRPQYNTWIELQYEQSQVGVLAYAERLIAEGYPPGVLMIDDTWQQDYGQWKFDRERFPDPKAMVDRLHAMGFLVMLWLSPQISADGRLYLDLRDQGLLVRDAAGLPAIRAWWNGHSAVLDMTNPAAIAWLADRLHTLEQSTGVDGWKFDAGDFSHYRDDDQIHVRGPATSQTQAWAAFAERWPLNELRACWQMGNRPLVQRLCDKLHSWAPLGGIAGCVPNTLALSLLGHPFSCPDLIGGGEYLSFNKNRDTLDGELFVRHAQLSALLPMQQFSAAPWRFLTPAHAALCREAALLHAEYGERIVALAEAAARTGEPIVRPLAWHWDDPAAWTVNDQFLLGPDLLVAPVVTKGATSRQVVLPPGRWREAGGQVMEGPATVTVAAPLHHLPRFERLA
jgi:alpha-glucosidase (family GH31 glycosyl hydrolase)